MRPTALSTALPDALCATQGTLLMALWLRIARLVHLLVLVALRVRALFSLAKGARLTVLQVRGQVEAPPVGLLVPAAGRSGVSVA